MINIKSIVANIKQLVDDLIEERDAEMEKWKEEDPEGYYDYLAMECGKEY